MSRNIMMVIAIVAVVAIASAAFVLAGNGGDRPAPVPDTPADSDVSTAVVYFSETENTKAVAEKIAKAAGGDLIRITPAVEYTSADLDYGNRDCRSNAEDRDDSARPGIANSMDLSGYDRIFLGYPIWYGDSPKIMWTFVETYDLSGKTVIPFCTSGSSGIGSSATHLKDLTHQGTWLDGKRFSGSASYEDVRSWVAGMGMEASA